MTLSVPPVYSGVLPFVLPDIRVAAYESICFPIYGIPKVRRRDYLIFDRAAATALPLRPLSRIRGRKGLQGAIRKDIASLRRSKTLKPALAQLRRAFP